MRTYGTAWIAAVALTRDHLAHLEGLVPRDCISKALVRRSAGSIIKHIKLRFQSLAANLAAALRDAQINSRYHHSCQYHCHGNAQAEQASRRPGLRRMSRTKASM